MSTLPHIQVILSRLTDAKRAGAGHEARCPAHDPPLRRSRSSNTQPAAPIVRPRRTCVGRIVDLVGRRFGYLVVIAFVRTEAVSRKSGKGTRAVWKCRCDCGKVKDVVGNYLKTGHTKSCGCKTRAMIRDKQFRGVGELPRCYFSSIIRRAKKNPNKPCNVSIEDMWRIFVNQGGRCSLTGLPLGFHRGSKWMASLNRIDNAKGYVHGNIEWVVADIQPFTIVDRALMYQLAELLIRTKGVTK